MNRRDEHLTAVIRDLDPERDPAAAWGPQDRPTRSTPSPSRAHRRLTPALAATAVAAVVAGGLGMGVVRGPAPGVDVAPAGDPAAVVLPVPEEPYDVVAWNRSPGCLEGFREGGTAPFYDGMVLGERSPDDVVRHYARSHLAAEFVGRSRRAITGVATMQLRRGPDKVVVTWFSPEGLPVAGVDVDRTGADGTWLVGGTWACAVGPDPAEPSTPPVLSTQPKP